MATFADDKGMHTDHSSVIREGEHNNTQLAELVVADSREQVDEHMLRKTESLVKYLCVEIII